MPTPLPPVAPPPVVGGGGLAPTEPRDLNLLPAIRAMQDRTVFNPFQGIDDLYLPEMGIRDRIPAPHEIASTFWGNSPMMQRDMLDTWRRAMGNVPTEQLIWMLQQATPGHRESPLQAMKIR